MRFLPGHTIVGFQLKITDTVRDGPPQLVTQASVLPQWEEERLWKGEMCFWIVVLDCTYLRDLCYVHTGYDFSLSVDLIYSFL